MLEKSACVRVGRFSLEISMETELVAPKNMGLYLERLLAMVINLFRKRFPG